MWPFLLGHYKYEMSTADRVEEDLRTRQAYETTMSEWLAVEAIVRQRDKEVRRGGLQEASNVTS